MSAILEGAASIARRVCSESIEHGGRCTWIGPHVVPGTGGAPEVIRIAAGPELYDGTAGISLALAEVAALVAEPALARTARRAMAHALSRAAEIPPDRAGGLHSGRVGVALAAARVGEVLGVEEFAEAARRLAGEVPVPAGADLIAGCAGGVLGLLSLAEVCEAPELVARAVELGEALIHAPVTGLAGLAHGDSGLLVAFGELRARTGDDRFGAAARAAADRERALFDADRGDWRDVRGAGAGEIAGFSPGWCAGSAGIALVRLRAWRLTGDERLRDEAEVALRATRKVLERELLVPGSDWCLCHGISGLIEALVDGGRPGAGRWSGRRHAADVAEAAVDRHERPGGAWPSRVPGLEWRGLMQGAPGVALFLARLHSPLIPSVLLPLTRAVRAGRGGRGRDDERRPVGVIGRPV